MYIFIYNASPPPPGRVWDDFLVAVWLFDAAVAGSINQQCRAEIPRSSVNQDMDLHLGVSENVVYPEKPNGFADHYPY